MNLTAVARNAVTEASNAIGATLTDSELEKVTSIISKAMEKAVLEATTQHTTACRECLSHDQDLAHKLQEQMERKKIALIANLSSMR